MLRKRTYFRALDGLLRDADIRIKYLIILIITIFLRIGSGIPIPFINTEYLSAMLDKASGFGFLNSLTGGSMKQMSFFALSVGPYITASIMVQMMTVFIPALDEMKRDGKTGEDRYKRVTMTAGIFLGFIQAVGMAVGFGRNGLLTPYTPFTVAAATLIWTMGAAVIIKTGDIITKMNIGDGMSIILFINIVAIFPRDVKTVREMYISGKPWAEALRNGLAFIVLFIFFIFLFLMLNDARKEYRVSQSKFISQSEDSHFAIPLCTCAVMPVIFAGTLFAMPSMAIMFSSRLQNGFIGHILAYTNTSNWFRPEMPVYTLGAIIYFAATHMFTKVYLPIGFNAYQIADAFKKNGTSFIGVRAGEETVKFIEKESEKTAAKGNALMVGIIMLMHCVCNNLGLWNLSIAGTALVICVNVISAQAEVIKAVFSKPLTEQILLWRGNNADTI